MTENTANGVAVNLNANKDPNAPWAIGSEDPNYNWHPEIFGNSPLVAASFNPQLMYDIGAFIGEESLFVGIPILWGPGLNTHRQSYNGRNGEYYSEDPVLAGVCAMEFAIGAQQYGPDRRTQALCLQRPGDQPLRRCPLHDRAARP